MNVFADYARYYDLFYRDKDYDGEVDYVCSLLSKYASGAKSMLELGCGTAAYTERFLKGGFSVDAVDISSEMLAIAAERLDGLPKDLQAKGMLRNGDARSIDMQKSYDVVTALFHVLSYQTTNEDVHAFLLNVARHLKLDGVGVIDFWYGPAVLTEKPSRREKSLVTDTHELTRIAVPGMRISENLVDVNYELVIKNLDDGATRNFQEKHVMRYFFLPELVDSLENAGLELLVANQWVSDEKPDEKSWNVCVVVKKFNDLN